MASKILGNVLPLSVRMGSWFLGNFRAVLSCVIAVCICVVDADGDRMAEADSTADLMRAKLSCDNRAFSDVELHAVRVDSQADCKGERLAQPSRCLIRI